MTLEDIIQNKINDTDSIDDLALILKNLLAYHSVWEDGRLYSIRALVDRVEGLKIEIFHDEHPPPHFHVTANGISAMFTIKDCEEMKGNLDSRELRLVKWWYNKSRSKLIKVWNDTRPSDCPVGPIIES